MSEPPAVPADLDGRHVLAVPRGADLLALARAWFPAAHWQREPAGADAPGTRPVAGARFRGLAVAAAPTAGVLTLDGVVDLVGPHPLDAAAARAAGLPARDVDLYGLPAAPPPGATLPPDQLTGWATAAARRTGGGILPAARDRAVVPDPGALLDLTLWSAVPVPAADAVPLLRPALSGSRLAPPAATAPGDAGFALAATFPYDGTVTVRCSRSARVPVVLSTLDWREHGPCAYHVAWRPPEALEPEPDHPSQLHVIARQRVAPAVARVVLALGRTAGGTVVDAGGFLVPRDEVAQRAGAR